MDLEPSTAQHGPTVILVGGAMTVDGGTLIDSRQPIVGDPECRVMRTCLGGSLLWWLTVTSVVDPILSDAGDGAFALVLGPRTLLDLQGDGSVRRTRLRAMVPGGLSTVKLLRTEINEKLPDGYEPAGTMDPSWTGASMGRSASSSVSRGVRGAFLTAMTIT